MKCTVYRFTKFSLTRWLGVGDSCRALVGALAVGLARNVELYRAMLGHEKKYLKAWDQLTPQLMTHFETVVREAVLV